MSHHCDICRTTIDCVSMRHPECMPGNGNRPFPGVYEVCRECMGEIEAAGSAHRERMAALQRANVLVQIARMVARFA